MTNSCYSSTPTLICESGKLGVSKRFQQGDPTTMSMPPSVSEKEHVHTFSEAKVMFSSLQFHQSVLWDMIEGFTEEIKLAGGIGCFEKRMSLFSSSFIGRPFFNATSGRHFYFHQETLASNRLCGFETASSSTSFSDLDVQKIESVTLSELNAYVVNPIPQETEFLCKTKVSDISGSKFYRKLQHGFTSYTCAWCNDEKAVRDLGYFKYRHHQGVPVNNNQCESGPNVEYAVTAPPLQAPTVENASSMEDRARTEENEMQSRRARSDHSIFWR
ncbi:unnamed protein product [Brassica oleracea var. botrytis]